jgi:hypothetical protein
MSDLGGFSPLELLAVPKIGSGQLKLGERSACRDEQPFFEHAVDHGENNIVLGSFKLAVPSELVLPALHQLRVA